MLHLTHIELGKLLMAARKKKGITQKELSRKLGFKYNAVGTWENGAGRIRYGELQKIVDILEIPLEDLKGYEHLWSR